MRAPTFDAGPPRPIFLSPRTGILLTIAPSLAFVVLFPIAVTGIGTMAVLLVLIPVTIFAWTFGAVRGVVGGIGGVLLNTGALLYWGIATPEDWFAVPQVAARAATSIFVGFGVGLSRDLLWRARVSEARTQSIINNMLGGLLAVDGRGVIESVNPAAERIFGYTRDELIGQPLGLLVPGQADQTATFLRNAFRSAIGRVTEWEARRKNGEVFPMELALFEFHTPRGRQFAGSIHDVSERRQVDRLKQEFVSTVSHELRTPLTSIRGSLSLLASGAMGDLPGDARELIGVAERNTVRLITLINDILDLERLQSGKIALQVNRVTAATVVERAIEAVGAFAAQHQVRLEVGPVAAPPLWADADRLVQVLVNLLSNAIKFSPAASAVTVSVVPRDRLVEIQVQDRGRGIPPSHQATIFDRFHQVEASDARQKGGTGLGLAICKAIVEQHGGAMGVNSDEGKGSTFWFNVPAAPAMSDPGGAARAGEAAVLASDQDTGMRAGDILLVEDDLPLLDVLTRQLAHRGLHARTATTGEAAIRLAEQRHPGLLILDVDLPCGDGYAVVEAFRQRRDLRGIPTLVYTGLDLSEEQRSRLRLGPTRFLTKTKSTMEDFQALVIELQQASMPSARPDHRPAIGAS